MRFKRQVPLQARLRCVQRRVRKMPSPSTPGYPQSNKKDIFSSIMTDNILVKLPIGTHDALATGHIALLEQPLLLRRECPDN